MSGEKTPRTLKNIRARDVTIITPEMYTLCTKWIPPALLEKASKKAK